MPLPDHVSDVEAAYNEPLAVGYNACARAGITPANAGSLNVVVIGCGPVGLATIACLLALGVSPDNICATDLSKARLETAQNYTPPDGVIPATATRQTINALHTPPELASDFAALSKAVRDMFANKTVDIVIDAASFPSTLGAAVRIVKPRGVIAVVGMGSISPPTPMLEISHKEIDLRGCFACMFSPSLPYAALSNLASLVNRRRIRLRPRPRSPNRP